MDYQKLYESLSLAYAQMENRCQMLEQQNAILILEKRQWEQDKVHQGQVIQKALSDANATSQAYLEENQVLREEIRRLKGNGNQH